MVHLCQWSVAKVKDANRHRSAVQRIALTNSLWFLTKFGLDDLDPEKAEISNWFWQVELERLTLAAPIKCRGAKR